MEEITFKRKGKEPVLLCSETQTPYLYFSAFERSGLVKHGFSTRLGGVSEGQFASMNLSCARGDEGVAVTANFRRIGDAIGFRMEETVTSDQTHTTNVRRVTKADQGKGLIRERDYTDIDGLITNEPDLVLTTYYADCVPLFFLDERNRAIGLSHSGWRGTVGKIGQVTVTAMQEAFGTDPADLLVGIGPSICMDCYEVSADVAEAFRKGFSGEEVSEILWDKGSGKFQLDLWRANQLILQGAGVRPEHITTTDICTCCNPQLLFSHRASQGKRGNLAGFLGLKSCQL